MRADGVGWKKGVVGAESRRMEIEWQPGGRRVWEARRRETGKSGTDKPPRNMTDVQLRPRLAGDERDEVERRVWDSQWLECVSS